MTIVAVTRQAPWLAGAIKAMLAGQTIDRSRPTSPGCTRGILVPLGPRDRRQHVAGVPAQRGAGGQVVNLPTEGDASCFIPRYLHEFGYTKGGRE